MSFPFSSFLALFSNFLSAIQSEPLSSTPFPLPSRLSHILCTHKTSNIIWRHLMFAVSCWLLLETLGLTVSRGNRRREVWEVEKEPGNRWSSGGQHAAADKRHVCQSPFFPDLGKIQRARFIKKMALRKCALLFSLSLRPQSGCI